jgi:hypothetical protein
VEVRTVEVIRSRVRRTCAGAQEQQSANPRRCHSP